MFRIRMRLQDMINKIKLSPGEKFAHLVLTVRSQENVKSMSQFLVRSFKKFRQRKIFQSHAVGGCYVMEITHNDSGWHVHLHCIIQALFIPQAELLSEWRSIVQHGGVFIKTIPKQAIINYLTKYMTKVELDGNMKEEAGCALKGFRLFTVFGIWHKLIKNWTKIPFECPDCGSVSWTLARDMDARDCMSEDGKMAERYG